MRPRKKRGPKNRYVQALRAQLDGHAMGENENEHASLELIAPLPILQQIISDWFDWIHPVAPILHRSLFTQRIVNFESLSGASSSSFLLLVASICAATTASLRRRRHLYTGVTTEGCLELADRFKLWSSTSDITLERTLTLYNFSSAVHHEYGIDSPLTHRTIGEASISVKYMIHQHLDQMSFMDQQILKRVYWLIFAGQCTYDMHGRRLLVLRHAHEPVNALLPLEISDEQLLVGGSEPSLTSSSSSQSSHHSYIPGLNALSRLFLVWQSSQAIPTQTMENLQVHISRAHRVLSDLPRELSWTGGQACQMGAFGFNVQKVNLRITQLHIRANLLEQMNTLAKDQRLRITPDAIIEERHRVVDELLDLLYRMPTEVFDANGYSVVPKIRDIGSALLDELRTGEHGRTLQASISLDKLLMRLEELDLRPMVHTPYF
ncbi:Nn.00g006250.m01.CDS01 [Neocucurbitaria sp. VM-36]